MNTPTHFKPKVLFLCSHHAIFPLIKETLVQEGFEVCDQASSAFYDAVILDSFFLNGIGSHHLREQFPLAQILLLNFESTKGEEVQVCEVDEVIELRDMQSYYCYQILTEIIEESAILQHLYRQKAEFGNGLWVKFMENFSRMSASKFSKKLIPA